MDELKPCPFCGGLQIELISSINWDGEPIFYIHCDGCGCSGPTTLTIDSAIAAWNRRAEDGGGEG